MMLKTRGMRSAILVLMLVGLGLWGDAGQSELHVCPEGCPFSSIQEAIDAASSGDVIQVEPGEYREPLVINKRVTLQGAGPDFVARVKELWDTPQEIAALREREEVAISGPGSIPGPVISIQEATVTISGFVIGKVYAHGDEPSSNDYGILVHTGSQVIIDNSVIVGNIAGIVVESAIASISSSIYYNNPGAGIDVYGNSQVTVTDSWIIENYGPAVDIENSSRALLLRNRIANNRWCIVVGGAAQVQIQDNQILQNDIGIYIYGEEAQVQILNNQFTDNIEGIHVEYGQAVIQNNRFEGQEEEGIWVFSQARLIQNTISGNKGDGIQIFGDAQVEAVGNEVVGNGGWGIIISGPSCDGYPFLFKGSIVGRENEIHNNARGDLCPEDYPWPEGFVKGP